jgi:hypothetical protein
VLHEQAAVEALAGLSGFRDGFYGCLEARADALFELADAVICADGPVTSLVELSLAPVFRRGHDSRAVMAGWAPSEGIWLGFAGRRGGQA